MKEIIENAVEFYPNYTDGRDTTVCSSVFEFFRRRILGVRA